MNTLLSFYKHKKNARRKGIWINEEIPAEREAFFAVRDKSTKKNEMLKKLWKIVSLLMEKVNFAKKF